MNIWSPCNLYVFAMDKSVQTFWETVEWAIYFAKNRTGDYKLIKLQIKIIDKNSLLWITAGRHK